MDCEACREVVSARLDGEATPAEEAAADAHLEGCADCRRAGSGAARITRLLRLHPTPAGPDLTDRVLGRAFPDPVVAHPPGASVVARLVPAGRCGCGAGCRCGCQQGRACRCGSSGCAQGAA